ncbi:hypothetical protein L7F22_063803 [Adiantum nelumboides]|nr:hypothetical protein [Adiantum nelumboides]
MSPFKRPAHRPVITSRDHRERQRQQLPETMASNDSSASHEVPLHAQQQRRQAEAACRLTAAPAEPMLCVNKCGFYGTPQNHNLCSCCFKLQNLSIAPSPALSSSPACPKEQVDAIATSSSSAPATEPPASALDPQKPNRCLACRKRVGLTGFKCRCGDVFCSSHRYSDQHQCPFDYKAVARQAIAARNPVVKGDKVTKL